MRLVLAAIAALAFASPAYAGGPAMRVGATEDRVKQRSLVEAKAQLELFKLGGPGHRPRDHGLGAGRA